MSGTTMTPIRRLPRHPHPHPGESLSSWLMRLSHANAQRLSYLTTHLTDNPNFWHSDPDRHLRAEIFPALTTATGLSEARLRELMLPQFVGTLFDRLHPQAATRWALPYAKRLYAGQRGGAVYCPRCLEEKSGPFLRLSWRLSFATVCPEHQLVLRESCPHCGAFFAPHLNDLGKGKDWSLEKRLPFGWCPQCECDLRGTGEPAGPEELAFQQRLTEALSTGRMAWDHLDHVPALEGFDVMHQVLSLLFLAGPWKAVQDVTGLPVPASPPARPNRTFEDFTFEDRRLLLAGLRFLVSDWPARFVAVCTTARLTRKPLVVNMPVIPAWYDEVADRFSRANGRRPYKRIPLAEHLDLDGIAARRAQATKPRERRRWEVLWHYHQQPEALPVARRLGMSWDFVARTVNRYNLYGPDWMNDANRARSFGRRRLLDEAQELELQTYIAASPGKPSNAELQDWCEARIGHRPDSSTLWMYRRGVAHTRLGRRARPSASEATDLFSPRDREDEET